MTRQRIRNEQISCDAIAERRIEKARERGEHCAAHTAAVEADRAAHLSDGETRAPSSSSPASSSKPRKSKRRR